MTQPNNPLSVSDTWLDGPVCPHCKVHTLLSVVEPTEPGHDQRTFRCALCGDEQIVAGDVEAPGVVIQFK